MAARVTYPATALLAMMFVVGCGSGAPPAEEAAQDSTRVQVSGENVVRARRDVIVVGPIVTGELRPEREATVRAELGGAIIEAMVEEGQTVRAGTLLARIEARTLEDARLSAQSAVRSAESQLDLSRREAGRIEQLVEAGAVAARDLDVARGGVTTAEAQVAEARARLASAERQLADTEIRAPFTGVISDRAVGAGDVVSPGTALFTLIDPSSMRLEASVPSDELSAFAVGTPVQFRVRGYDRSFDGRIVRIAPQADPTTRQVPIYVSIPNEGGQLLAGLFAEGRVVTDTADGIVVPGNVVNESGATPWVVRVREGRTERVDVAVGLRDARSELVQVTDGLTEGDVLLRGPAQGITPGTAVQVETPGLQPAPDRAVAAGDAGL
ncbi:MAG: efflux RND transporter periplasmic adaptor subunit [Acidobacteria bacterium]|nr:efflux RND transporter periplasmic adaptor subunit [Acidobacteriota bacterium]